LPDDAPAEAAEGLSAAVQAAAGDPAVLAAAGAAYDAAFLAILAVVAVLVAVTALVTGRLLRHHGPGTPASAYESNH
ncbi:MAG TPA: MFS transporter, partial [Citricoccus sp.]